MGGYSVGLRSGQPSAIRAMSTPNASQLGKETPYPSNYDPGLLFPIQRREARERLGLGVDLPFVGVDVWNAYELSWLDLQGKPQVALGRFEVPADSPHLIESKSFKLYLNSLNAERLPHADALRHRLEVDLGAAAGAPVQVELVPLATAPMAFDRLHGELIDDLPVTCSHYGPPQPDFLRVETETRVEEALVSHLLKSNCPVTGQPDWASVRIAYCGPRIDRAGLLRYLVSFREHNDFHEACVERIFEDIRHRCAPLMLSVMARYTRRGGLDINPFRSTPGAASPGNPRLPRQ